MGVRISGDEFAVLLPDGSQGSQIAARLLELIARPYAVNGHAMTLSISIGLAQARGCDEDADDLLQAANIALHRAEADGKNRWCLYEPWVQQRASTRQVLEMDLRAALAANKVELRKAMAVDQFEVHYRPQVDAKSLRLLGFEALVRWRHPLRGLVGPDVFIPLAEEIGLIGLLGDRVLRTACRTAAAWPASPAGKPYWVAVNVSPLQLRERRALVASIADALASSGLAPERLEIEITESALIGDALETLQGIKALGVGMSTVAEGVETQAQAEMVFGAGVTVVQGHLIAQPTPEAGLAALIRRLELDVALNPLLADPAPDPQP